MWFVDRVFRYRHLVCFLVHLFLLPASLLLLMLNYFPRPPQLPPSVRHFYSPDQLSLLNWAQFVVFIYNTILKLSPPGRCPAIPGCTPFLGPRWWLSCLLQGKKRMVSKWLEWLDLISKGFYVTYRISMTAGDRLPWPCTASSCHIRITGRNRGTRVAPACWRPSCGLPVHHLALMLYFEIFSSFIIPYYYKF